MNAFEALNLGVRMEAELTRVDQGTEEWKLAIERVHHVKSVEYSRRESTVELPILFSQSLRLSFAARDGIPFLLGVARAMPAHPGERLESAEAYLFFFARTSSRR
ncbi:MAG: hypothetical protein R3F11_19895 [Verrucomicrobiales bacterium]